MELKITTLIENMPDKEECLACEHGLSLYIEFDGKKILFDTGQTGAFLDNARKLDKPVEDVDYIIISHGHYDHSGGVPGLMEELSIGRAGDIPGQKEVSRPIPMYIGAEFFDKKYKHLSDGSYRYNGNPFEETLLTNTAIGLHKVHADVTSLSEKILLFKNFKRFTDFEKRNEKFVVERACEENPAEGTGRVNNHEFQPVPDDFPDEMALGLRTSKGLVLVVGCSHVGIVNIIRNVTERVHDPIHCVLGGTHLIEADEERLKKTTKALLESGISQIAVSHCTGEPGMEYVAGAFGERFMINNTGNVYTV